MKILTEKSTISEIWKWENEENVKSIRTDSHWEGKREREREIKGKRGGE